MTYSSNRTQDLEFWRERIRESPEDILRAMGAGFDWETIDAAHKTVFKKLGVSGVVLDVGCGPGRSTPRWFSPDNYVGIDFLPEFIEAARRRFPLHRFGVQDITRSLPFRSGEFDWALLISVKVVIAPVVGKETWDRVEKELKRVARNVLILEYAEGNAVDAVKYELL